ncbi:unnamed protein product [Paramecium sonneborni]|uniref:Uncharacterized protein n=1 Tax=Paramecium sonneborni TaxID=65129 RepID=A0A8S1LI63_9CILI|nr:unnamed protein product [Paramecium sonneborni]
MQFVAQFNMIEKVEDLVCVDHQKYPKFILVNENLDLKKRLVCEDCLKAGQVGIQPKTLDQMKQIIIERVKKRNELPNSLILETIKQAENTKQTILDIESKIHSQIETIKSTAERLISALNKVKQENQNYSFFTELNDFVHNQEKSHEEMVKTIQQFNINWFGKIKLKIKNLPQDLDKLLEKVRTNTQEFYQKHYDIIHKPLEFELIENNNIKQRDPCYTLAFSKSDNNVLFSGSGKQIKVWNFDKGKIKEVARLNAHILSVTCIVTSNKVKNSFVSGSECGQLIIWKQKTQQEWESQIQKSQWPNSIILNKYETQLIIATATSAIEIWDVDFNQNKLAFKYSLDDFHTNTIFDLSLNPQENRMVSCGDDNKIIVWKKEKEDPEWTVFQEINSSNYGTKVAFITDQSFIWMRCDSKGEDKQINDKDRLQLYELVNNQYQINPFKFYQFDKDEKFIDFHLTPIIQNNKKQVYFIRFKRSIYILKLEVQDFQLVTKLKFESNLIYATLSEDAQYLVVYLEDKQQYQVHQIKWN